MWITRRSNAFQQIRAQKTLEPAQPFILGGVNKLMHNERTLIPTIDLNKNAITKREASRRNRNKIRRIGCCCQCRICRGRNLCNPEQPHTLWLYNTDLPGICKLRLCEPDT